MRGVIVAFHSIDVKLPVGKRHTWANSAAGQLWRDAAAAGIMRDALENNPDDITALLVATGALPCSKP